LAGDLSVPAVLFVAVRNQGLKNTAQSLELLVSEHEPDATPAKLDREVQVFTGPAADQSPSASGRLVNIGRVAEDHALWQRSPSLGGEAAMPSGALADGHVDVVLSRTIRALLPPLSVWRGQRSVTSTADCAGAHFPPGDDSILSRRAGITKCLTHEIPVCSFFHNKPLLGVNERINLRCGAPPECSAALLIFSARVAAPLTCGGKCGILRASLGRCNPGALSVGTGPAFEIALWIDKGLVRGSSPGRVCIVADYWLTPRQLAGVRGCGSRQP